MSDIADDAQEQIEATLELALLQSRTRQRQLLPAGACHFCGEDVKPQHLFCDADCRSLWEREQAARKRNGT